MELLHKVKIDNMDFLIRSIGNNETKQYKTTVYIESNNKVSSGVIHTEYHKSEDEMKRRHRYIYKNLEMYIMVDLK
jgi:Trk K+ transport system NAD-binding subunit